MRGVKSHEELKPLRPQDIEFVNDVLNGKPKTVAWKEHGIAQATAEKILMRQDVRKMMSDAATLIIRTNAKKAAAKIAEQLDDKNPWVVQSAARLILDYERFEEKNTNTDIVVNFGNMPVPGMPERLPENTAAEVEGSVQ